MSMLSSLEPRYRRILKLIAEGLTSREIAQLTGLSRHSIDTYVKELKRELVNEPEAHGRLPSRTVLATIYQRLTAPNTPAPEPLNVLSNQDWSIDRLLTFSQLLNEVATSALWSGVPKITAHIASSATKELEAILQRVPTQSDYRDEFLDIFVQLLIQQGWAYSQLSPFHTNWCLDRGFDKTLQRIGEQYGQSELAILAEFFLADGYSLAFDQRKVVKSLQNALQAAEGINYRWLNNIRFLGLVKLAGTWANLVEEQKVAGNESYTEQREFWRLAQLIEGALGTKSQIDTSDVAYAYDRLATATAAFHQPIARDYLDKARYYTTLTSASDTPVPIREVQLVDVELAVRKGLDPGSSYADMEGMATKAIEKALSIGCTRLAIHIQGWFT